MQSRSDVCFFSSLPAELIITIAGFITSRNDLLAFINTCRVFQGAGDRVLYAHIEIHRCWQESSPLLATLYHRPDLARHIKSYRGPLQINPLSRDPVWKLIQNLGSQPVELGQAPGGYFPILFKHATCIRKLEILDDRKISWFKEQTLATIGRMPLNKLVAFRQGDKPMPLTDLLRVKPSIRQLEIEGDISDWDLERLKGEDLPNLESLAAQISPTKILVPGRPIHSVEVRVFSDEIKDEDLWIKLSQSSASVLKLDLWEWSSEDLKQAALHLPQVRCLRLRGYFVKVEEVRKSVLDDPQKNQ